MDVDDLREGELGLGIETPGNTVVILDGFALVKRKEVPLVKINEEKLNKVPKQIAAGIPNGVILKYDDIKELLRIGLERCICR